MSEYPEVKLEISQYGRPIVYIADYYEKCIPGVAVEYVSNRIVLSTREVAVLWAKKQVSLMAGFDWSTWKQDPDDYPDDKNRDNPELDPTFIATIGNWPQEPLYTVKVYKTEVCETP